MANKKRCIKVKKSDKKKKCTRNLEKARQIQRKYRLTRRGLYGDCGEDAIQEQGTAPNESAVPDIDKIYTAIKKKDIFSQIEAYPGVWDEVGPKQNDETVWLHIAANLCPTFNDLTDSDKLCLGSKIQTFWDTSYKHYSEYCNGQKSSFLYLNAMKFLRKNDQFPVKKEEIRGKSTTKTRAVTAKLKAENKRKTMEKKKPVETTPGPEAEVIANNLHDEEQANINNEEEIYEVCIKEEAIDPLQNTEDSLDIKTDVNVSTNLKDKKENPHMLFLKSLLPMIRNFSEKQTYDFQMELLDVVRGLQSQ